MEHPAKRHTPQTDRDARPHEGSFAPELAPMSPEAIVRDLQSVLGAVVARLHESLSGEHVTAWALRENGEPYVAAAAFAGNPPAEPVRSAFDLLCDLPGPTDLREPGHSEAVRQLAERLHCSAAVPVAASDGTPMAVLLVGDGSAVRPRTLAALDSARRRLEAPLAAALAMGRLRELDDVVCRTDRLAALGSLASEIAHEVRNPLVSIKTFLQLLPERRDDPAFFTEFFEIASSELQRMERLLDVVLHHGRPTTDPPRREPADVAATFAAVDALVRHRALKRGASFETEAEDGLPRVAAAEDALRQVVLNLALNAIDAVTDHGAVRLRASKERNGVTITVSDTGPGIPEALRTRIFEPFFSTRREAPGGLGLAITRRLVEGAGGEIAVASSDSGAEFRIWLPGEV
jgi:signal transduction histidine kinase